MPITLPHHFNPRSYQQPLLEYFERGGKRADCAWHRRSGKGTRAVAGITIPKMLERVGLYLHTFPTAAQARKIIWDGINRQGMRFLDHFPRELVADMNQVEMSVTLTNGSRWELWGTDFFDRLVGTNPVGVVYDEFALQDVRARQFLQPALRENGGWELIIGTFRGKNHAWKLHESVKGNPEWFTSHLTVEDTCRDAPGEDGRPVISLADIEADRRDGMEEALIQQEYFLDVNTGLVGAYYTRQLAQARAEGRIRQVPYNPRLLTQTWHDLGVSDSHAVLWTQIDGRFVYVIDCLSVTGEGLPYVAMELRNRVYHYDRYRSHHAPHDISTTEWGTGKTRLEQAREHGIFFNLVPRISRADGINAARSFLDRCVFDAEKCEPLLAALANYHKEYDERTKLFRDAPAHDWSSHFADAFRYLAVGFREGIDQPTEQTETHALMSFDVYRYAEAGGREGTADMAFDVYRHRDQREEERRPDAGTYLKPWSER